MQRERETMLGQGDRDLGSPDGHAAAVHVGPAWVRSHPQGAAKRRVILKRAPKLRAGFTLTELIIATSLSGIVLAGVLTAFLLIGRAGFNASAYADMSSALRNSLDQFHRDARLASDIRWHDQRRLTLLLPLPSGETESVTYGYEPSPADPATGVFYRETLRNEIPVRAILARNIANDFAFQRYRIASAENLAPAAANDLETKLVEVNLRAVRRGASGAPVSQNAVSARCLLRNKSVAQ